MIKKFIFLKILIPSSCANSDLSLVLKENFPNSVLSTPSRKYFNDTKGMDLINSLIANSKDGVEKIISTKYLATSAAAALLKYVEHIQHFTFSNNTLKVKHLPNNVNSRLYLIPIFQGDVQGT